MCDIHVSGLSPISKYLKLLVPYSNWYFCLSCIFFQYQVSEILRQRHIQPHWMFALDNLLRTAVQCAITVISPGKTEIIQEIIAQILVNCFALDSCIH